jgi:hypothetical protein
MTAEWRHVTQRFRNFIANLQPTTDQRRAVQAAAADVAACLSEKLIPPGPHPTAIDHMVIGGHAKGTAIQPAQAADMLYILPAETRPSCGPRDGWESPLPHQLAAELEKRYTQVERAREGWLAVIHEDNARQATIAVRVIPCFPFRDGGFLITRSHTEITWRYTDPTAENTALHEANQASANKATHLVLMLKAWRRARRVSVVSLALELLVCEFVSVWTYHRRSLLFYDWMIRDFFFWMGHQENRELLIPGGVELLQVGNHWIQEVQAAYRLAENACRLERDNRDDEATGRWQEIFGAGFSGAPASLAENAPAWLPAPGRVTPAGTA